MELGREDGGNETVLVGGADIALKCSIVSSPLHHTILWTKQVSHTARQTEKQAKEKGVN